MGNHPSARVLLALAVLAWNVGTATRGAAAEAVEVWKNEDFIKRAEAIKRGDWQKMTTRDVAIVQLYEIGKEAERLQRQLSAQMDRFYALAYRGALALGAFLLLHLLLTFALWVRLGRLGRRVYGDDLRT